MVNVSLVNMSHVKCEFGKYELLHRFFLVNLKVVNLLFGANKLAPKSVKIIHGHKQGIYAQARL